MGQMSYNRGKPQAQQLLANLGRVAGVAGLVVAGVGINASLFNGTVN